MPKCGSQIILCDLPIRFDTYTGCEHGCVYCFTRKKATLNNVKRYESAVVLQRFIDGFRTRETKWCDWNIPLHWGGLSDPFQPIERILGQSLQCLEVFAQTEYPFVFSSKATLPTEDPYLSLLRQCNVVSQISMVSPRYDKWEPYAPSFAARLASLSKLARVSKRVIVRVQPYCLGLSDEIISLLPRYRDAGVYGVTIEGMKRSIKKTGLVKVAGDWCYPVTALQHEYERIKSGCHSLGLAFLCAENRLRHSMSDDPCCCGTGDLEGFRVNTANMNHLTEGVVYTRQMHLAGTAQVFRAMAQTTLRANCLKESSYAETMEKAMRVKTFRRAMGYLPEL